MEPGQVAYWSQETLLFLEKLEQGKTAGGASRQHPIETV